jgi:hypothetical protein
LVVEDFEAVDGERRAQDVFAEGESHGPWLVQG